MQVGGVRVSRFPGGRDNRNRAPLLGGRVEAGVRQRLRDAQSDQPSPLMEKAACRRAVTFLGWCLSVPVLRLLFAASGLLSAALLVTFTVVLVTGRGAIYPQVQVLDVPVGGLSPREAETRVGARLATVADTPVTLRLGERVWTPTLSDVGVNLDVEGSVAAAMTFGRENHRVAGLLHQAHLMEDPYTVPLGIRFDDARFDAYLDSLDTEVDVAPINATLTVDGVEARVEPGQTGLTLDRRAVRDEVLEQVRRLQPVSVELATLVVPPPVPETVLEPLAATVERALSRPMVLSADDRHWPLDPEDLGALVVVDPGTRNGITAQPAVSLDSSRLRVLLEGVVAEAATDPSNAYIDETGSAPRLVPAVAGLRIDIDTLVRAVQAAFQNGEHAVALPGTEVPPAVSTDAFLANLGVTHLVASGDSDFAGSEPGREQNVRVAAELVDLTLVPPGGVFSYNRALGSIVEDPRFVPAQATEGGIIGTSIGGGVCQVSTTVFRAALRAGLPIVEWWPHVHRSPFYEQGGWGPGFDASIAQADFDPLNGSDFKFSNPTDSWMLVRATAREGTTLTVELYGTPTGYSAEIDDPVIEVTEWASGTVEHVDPSLPAGTTVEDGSAQDGATVAVVRRVLNADGTLIAADEFVSAYQPHGTVYRVSPDMAGTTGATPT